jgi:hypothetical protein
MNDPTAPMHIIQPEQHLLGDLPDQSSRHARGLVAFDEAEEVLPEDLEDHADVLAVRADMLEVVEEGDDMAPAWMRLGWRRRQGRGRHAGGDEPLQELDLVQRGLGVLGCGLDDFERDVPVGSA